MSRLVTPLPSALAHAPLQIPCSFAVTLRDDRSLMTVITLTCAQDTALALEPPRSLVNTRTSTPSMPTKSTVHVRVSSMTTNRSAILQPRDRASATNPQLSPLRSTQLAPIAHDIVGRPLQSHAKWSKAAREHELNERQWILFKRRFPEPVDKKRQLKRSAFRAWRAEAHSLVTKRARLILCKDSFWAWRTLADKSRALRRCMRLWWLHEEQRVLAAWRVAHADMLLGKAKARKAALWWVMSPS